MIRRNTLMIFLGVITLFTFSCVDNDPDPVKDLAYNNGLFIVNEGNFTDSDGSLSFMDHDSLQVVNKVFETINDRPFAGVMQSMAFYEGRGYLVDQLGRIEIVDEESLENLATIDEGFISPRYIAFSGNKGFVSDWGPYDEFYASPNSKIKVVDLEKNEITTEFSTPSRPEAMLVIGEMLYVANSASNVISVYSVDDNSLETNITINDGPIQFLLDGESNLWVVSNGNYISGGALQKISISVNQVVKTIDLSSISPSGRICINGSGDTIFLIGEVWAPDYSFTETKVYKLTTGQPENITEIISGRNFYGIGADPLNDVLYVSNNEAFQGNGTIYSYDFSGIELDDFKVGRGPREFVFMIP